MLPLHQAAFSALVDTGARTLFFRCTDGCFTNKLESTFVIGAGFEPASSDSKSEMLTIALSNNKAVRMRVELIASDRSASWRISRYTNEPFVVCTGFEPVSSSRKLDILNR